MTVMSRFVAGSVALVLAGGLTACGVPQWTDVVAEGSGPGAEPAGVAVPRVPPGPDEARDEEQLVQYFLQAAAADPGNAGEQLRPFIHSSQQDDYRPNQQVWVVRVEEGSPVLTPSGSGKRVKLTVQPLGILNDGVVEPRTDRQTVDYEFQVVPDPAIVDEQVGAGVDRVRYRVLNPPNDILLDQRALAERGYLRPTSIYVWDDDNGLLVPDLRWLPTAASPAQAVQAKLEWLIDGPAPWLDSMSGLPGNLELQGNPVWREERRLDVAFTTSEELREEVLRRIDAQVWWTLRDLLPERSTVSLTINGESRQVTGAHASVRSIRYREAPASFVLLSDSLVPYVSGDTTPPDIPLASDTLSAALTGRGQEATLAMVHRTEEGPFQLSIATANGILETDLTAARAMSRPAWLRHPPGTGLVAADGTLYRFTAGETAVHEVIVPGLSGDITALSVAPDGRRLALVADGEVWVASLVRRDDRIGVNQPQRLPTAFTDVSGVAFIQENWIAIIGRDPDEDRIVLAEVTVDGAYEQELPNGDLGAPQTVANLVGYPGDPDSFNPRGSLMYEFEGYAVRYDYPRGPSKIQVEELGTEPPAEDAEPQAPFFAE